MGPLFRNPRILRQQLIKSSKRPLLLGSHAHEASPGIRYFLCSIPMLVLLLHQILFLLSQCFNEQFSIFLSLLHSELNRLLLLAVSSSQNNLNPVVVPAATCRPLAPLFPLPRRSRGWGSSKDIRKNTDNLNLTITTLAATTNFGTFLQQCKLFCMRFPDNCPRWYGSYKAVHLS